MAADDQTSVEKSKILHCVRQVCTGVEIRTKRTAQCPLVLKCILPGGEEGFPDEAFGDEDIGKNPPPFPGPKHGGGWRSRGEEGRVTTPPRRSHDRAALGLLLLEGGREQLGAAGQVEKAFGEAAVGARLSQRLKLVDASQGRGAENAVDAFLWCEGWALQVCLGPKLLGHGWTLEQRREKMKKKNEKALFVSYTLQLFFAQAY